MQQKDENLTRAIALYEKGQGSIVRIANELQISHYDAYQLRNKIIENVISSQKSEEEKKDAFH